jgi:hypothetical protein
LIPLTVQFVVRIQALERLEYQSLTAGKMICTAL